MTDPWLNRGGYRATLDGTELIELGAPAGETSTGVIAALAAGTNNDAWFDLSSYGGVGDGTTDNSAALAGAIAAVPLAGTSIGGDILIPVGDYAVNRQYILPTHCYIRGTNPGGLGSIIRTGSTFPHAIKSGAITLPQATIAVTSMPATAQTAGVFSLVSTTGIQFISYTGKSGNSFTGCTGGTGNVSDASVVGFPMFVFGDPSGPTDVFGAGLRDLGIYLSTTNTPATCIPGASAFFSNRIQEFAGLQDVSIVNVIRNAIAIRLPPTFPVVPQNWRIRGVGIGMGSTFCESTAVAVDIEMNRSTDRGIEDLTISSYASVQATAGVTGVRLSGSTSGIWNAQVELVTTGLYLDNTGAAGTVNGPVDIANWYSGQVTTAIHIGTSSGYAWPYTLRDIRKDVGSTNLIVDDHVGRTITAISVGWYQVGLSLPPTPQPVLTDIDAGVAPTSLALVGSDPETVTLSATNSGADVNIVEFGTTTIASDTFTRTAGAPGTADVGGAWTENEGSTWATDGTTLFFNATSTQEGIATLTTAASDLTFTADMKLSATRAAVGLVFRFIDVNNFLSVLVAKNVSTGADHVVLSKRVATVDTVLVLSDDTGLVLGTTYQLKVVLTGKRIRVYLNGSILIDHTMTGADATTLKTPTKHGTIIVVNSGTSGDIGGSGGSHVDNVVITTPAVAISATGSLVVGGGAVSGIATSYNALSGSVTMTTAGTYYDGPTLTLTAGTYILTGKIMVVGGGTGHTWTSKLWDGTTAVSNGVFTNTGGLGGGEASLPHFAVVTPGSSTTYKISVTSDANGDTIPNVANGSQLLAIKIA